MSRILAIETATEACSAALLLDGEIHERYELAPQGHARLILPMAEELLTEAGLILVQLDCVAFGRGPGSFTGVRIATGVIQGIAFGADLPVVPVSSLAALAQPLVDAGEGDQVLCAFDARMGQVYWGAYAAGDDGLVVLQDEERVCDPEHIPIIEGAGRIAAGSGWAVHGEAMAARLACAPDRILPDAMPHAAGVARLAAREWQRGNAVAAEQAQPVYLRDQVAQKAR